MINDNRPVLLFFFTEWNKESIGMHPTMRDLAATLGDKAKVIKIDVDKNPDLADALRVKGLLTLMIYKDGEQRWRHFGPQTFEEILTTMNTFL